MALPIDRLNAVMSAPRMTVRALMILHQRQLEMERSSRVMAIIVLSRGLEMVTAIKNPLRLELIQARSACISYRQLLQLFLLGPMI